MTPAAPMSLSEQLLAALGDLDAAIASLPSARPDLRAIFRRIDELAAQLPPDADPRLRHFLDQKSYQKARNLLAAGHAG